MINLWGDKKLINKKGSVSIIEDWVFGTHWGKTYSM